MFNNIGQKLKNWAFGVFIVETIAAVIGGIVLIAQTATPIGFLLIIFGPFAAQVTAMPLYAFGEIVDKLTGIEKNTSGLKGVLKEIKSEQVKNDSVRVEEVKKLYSLGLITEEEYQEKINQIEN